MIDVETIKGLEKGKAYIVTVENPNRIGLLKEALDEWGKENDISFFVAFEGDIKVIDIVHNRNKNVNKTNYSNESGC